MSQAQLQPVAIHETMESGLTAVRFGTMGPGEHPIGSMDAVDQSDPLALTDREQAVVDSWEQGKVSPDSPDSRLPANHPDVEEWEQRYDMEARDSGFVAPVDAKKDDSAQGSPGFMSSLSGFLSRHKGLTMGVGAVGGAMGITAADAIVEPTQAKATFEWEHVGGDPFVDGGIQTKDELERVMKSARGKEALRDQGLNGKEIRAVIDAVDDSDGDRDVRNCSLNAGDDFDTMVFGDSGVIASDVIYTGSPEAAFCVDVKMPSGKVINVKIPKGCGNIAIDSMMRKPPKKPPTHKPPTGNLVLTKAFEDANGNPLSISGQEFQASCVVKGVGRVTNTFEYNPAQRRGPVTAIRGCKVGKVATMMELTSPADLAHWDVLTGKPVVKNGQTVGFVQKQKVDKGRNLFGFKNRQKRPDRPTQPDQPDNPVFLPPSISIASWDHIKTGDIQEICSFESDPDGDIVSTVFTENGNGFFTTDPNHPYLGDEAGEKCVKYAAGSLGQEGATITSTVRDARNQSASATEVFDIVGSEDPRGEF